MDWRKIMNSRQSEAQKESGQPELQKEKDRPEDTAIYTAIGRYLDGLVPQLNLRLLCDLEADAYGFPQRILWVENITVYQIKEKAAVCGDVENDCQAEELQEELEEKALTGRIKYKLKQLKNNWKKLWKKKGR